jgi:hypothetical protein
VDPYCFTSFDLTQRLPAYFNPPLPCPYINLQLAAILGFLSASVANILKD